MGGGNILEKSPKPPNSLKETINSLTHVIVNSKGCSKDHIKLLFVSTGRLPIDYLWILDSISNFKILDIDRYQLIHEDPIHGSLETQQSLAF
jgi:hypothetical protein